ncbi:MAG: DUF6460 domain-containing protein [Hyphomicrobiales bacterium]|nr:DUF6460 domain-containing protein [Hyphomicrobiales bacterium]
MERILGGSPLGVAIRLVVASIIVGVVLTALGLSPFELLDAVGRFATWVYELGFDSLDVVVQYFLLGAAVVIPVWLIYRLLKVASGGDKG